jgi:hypothetical protein
VSDERRSIFFAQMTTDPTNPASSKPSEALPAGATASSVTPDAAAGGHAEVNTEAAPTNFAPRSRHIVTPIDPFPSGSFMIDQEPAGEIDREAPTKVARAAVSRAGAQEPIVLRRVGPTDAHDTQHLWPPPPPKAKDLWRHRRGEPRLFAFFWLVWMTIASALCLAPLGPLGLMDVDASRPACRRLLLLMMVGAVVLWPTIRLSQALPRSPVRAIFQDFIVVLIGAQAILWPMMLLGWWAARDIAGVAGVLAAWMLVAGAAIVVAMRHIEKLERVAARPMHVARALWTLLIMVGAFAVPLVGLAMGLWRPTAAASLWAMTSPMTAVYELLRDRRTAGPGAYIQQIHWRAIGVTLCVGLIAWGIALALNARVRPARSRI